MAEGFPQANQNGVPLARIVQSTWPPAFRGFLLAKSKPTIPATPFVHTAFYTDTIKEDITPPTGLPRPDPDLAERTKRLKLPASVIAGPGSNVLLPSSFTGLMRQFVQYDYINGVETKFRSKFSKTHGILEFPYPRNVGATKGQEDINRKDRRYWIIEISAEGIYSAPVSVGKKGNMIGLERYLPSSQQLVDNPSWSVYTTELSLKWAYENNNEGGAVQSLALASEYNKLFAYGVPWAQRIGWAFNLAGTEAANVTQVKIVNEYKTRLLTIKVNVSFNGSSAYITLIAPNKAKVVQGSHGILEGGLAVVTGADQSQYNGTFVATNVGLDSFEYTVSGSPASPATGSNLKEANATNPTTLSATVTVGTEGHVSFRPNSVLWYALTPTKYFPTIPAISTFPYPTVVGSGPVYVYYDENEQQLVSWKYLGETVTPGFATENYFPAPHVTSVVAVPNCQSLTLTSPSYITSSASSGTFTQLGIYYQFGFYLEGSNPFSAVGRDDTAGQTPSTTIVNISTSNSREVYQEFSANGIRDYCGGGYVDYATWSFTIKFKRAAFVSSSSTHRETRESYVLIPWHDRECVGFITVAYTGDSTGVASGVAEYAHQTIKQLLTQGPGGGTISSYTLGRQQEGSLMFTNFYNNLPAYNGTIVNTSNTTQAASFRLVASRGYSVVKDFSFSPHPGNPALLIADPEFVRGFVGWQGGYSLAKLISGVDSDLFYMRGGLSYSDPNLDPPDQRLNIVQSVGEPINAIPGFAALTGKDVTCFVGMV